jgi:hypothetical protein
MIVYRRVVPPRDPWRRKRNGDPTLLQKPRSRFVKFRGDDPGSHRMETRLHRVSRAPAPVMGSGRLALDRAPPSHRARGHGAMRASRWKRARRAARVR